MKKIWIIFFVWLGGNLSLGADLPPVSIVLDENYSKSLAIRLNGEFVPNKLVLEKLSSVMKLKDKGFPVVVLMPGQVRLDDWEEIKGLLDKVGFLNVRYFAFSPNTKMMVELDRHNAVPFSLNPSQRDKGAARDNY